VGAAWTVQPSASAKYVIEYPNLILMRTTANTTTYVYNYGDATVNNGTANITVTADANTLTNTILASNVVTSSLTSVGTLGALAVTGNITAPANPTLKTHATNRGYVDKKAVAMAVALG
jgi:archaellum component FlaG (FlaF/FlaG flagellin family)